MHQYSRCILIIASILLIFSSFVYGQGLGAGVGSDDVAVHSSRHHAAVPCTTFVTDYSVACNVIVLVTTGIAQ